MYVLLTDSLVIDKSNFHAAQAKHLPVKSRLLLPSITKRVRRDLIQRIEMMGKEKLTFDRFDLDRWWHWGRLFNEKIGFFLACPTTTSS